MLRAIVCFAVLLCCAPVSAAVWYCDPVNGSAKGDGSSEKPWGSLESIVRSINVADATVGKVRAGDTLKLRSGNHGRVIMQPGKVNGQTVNPYAGAKMTVIEADKGHTPILDSFLGQAIGNWTFRDLTVLMTPQSIKAGIMLRIGDSNDILVERVTVRQVEDINQWTQQEWHDKTPSYGMWYSGKTIVIRKCLINGVHNGCGLDGDKVTFEDNVIEGFLNDGMNVSSGNTLIARNRITDQMEGLDDNHHDGIQVFDLTGEGRSNLTIRDNYIARSTGKYKAIPTVAVASDYDVLQGIVLFNGVWRKVVVENNVVISTAYNGIVLSGAKDSVIRGNTVISQSQLSSWVCVRDNRDGDPTESVICERNLSPSYLIMSKQGVTARENYSYDKPLPSWNHADCKQLDPTKTFYFYDRQRGIYDLGIRPESPAADKQVLVTTPGAGARQ